NRRLQTIGTERQETVYPFGGICELPADFARLRRALLGDGRPLGYVPPSRSWPGAGGRYFTIVGGGDGSCSTGGGATLELMPSSALGDMAGVLHYLRGFAPALP